MIKINKNSIMLFLLLAIALIIISSCAKGECKNSADCGSRTCYLSKCESKKCVYTLQTNCCGNNLKDSIENGKPGSQCSCPEDYGKCEGKGKIKIGSRTEDAAYAHYYCDNNNKCVLGIESKDVVPQNFLDTISIGFFKASSVIKYNKPFEMSRNTFDFKLALDDISKDLVLPVKMTKIKLLYSSEYARAELLIAEKELDSTLNSIGEQVTINVPLNLGYKPQEVEETGSMRYSIDYAYTKKVASGRAADGTTLYNEEQVRATFTAPAKQVFFVRSG